MVFLKGVFGNFLVRLVGIVRVVVVDMGAAVWDDDEEAEQDSVTTGLL